MSFVWKEAFWELCLTLLSDIHPSVHSQWPPKSQACYPWSSECRQSPWHRNGPAQELLKVGVLMCLVCCALETTLNLTAHDSPAAPTEMAVKPEIPSLGGSFHKRKYSTYCEVTAVILAVLWQIVLSILRRNKHWCWICWKTKQKQEDDLKVKI